MIRTASRRLGQPRALLNACPKTLPISLAAIESPPGTTGTDTPVPFGTTTSYFSSYTHGFTTFAAKLAQTERREQELGSRGQELEQHLEEADPVRQEQRPVPEEIVIKYRAKMDSLQKKRKRVPLSTGESYDSWLETNDESLEPLREFFRLHEMEASWAIAELYKNGYWGKKLMTGHVQGDRGHSGGMQRGSPNERAAMEQPTFPWEKALEIWSKAFEAEKLPHSPMDIVRRWPSLLCKVCILNVPVSTLICHGLYSALVVAWCILVPRLSHLDRNMLTSLHFKSDPGLLARHRSCA